MHAFKYITILNIANKKIYFDKKGLIGAKISEFIGVSVLKF